MVESGRQQRSLQIVPVPAKEIHRLLNRQIRSRHHVGRSHTVDDQRFASARLNLILLSHK